MLRSPLLARLKFTHSVIGYVLTASSYSHRALYFYQIITYIRANMRCARTVVRSVRSSTSCVRSVISKLCIFTQICLKCVSILGLHLVWRRVVNCRTEIVCIFVGYNVFIYLDLPGVQPLRPTWTCPRSGLLLFRLAHNR